MKKFLFMFAAILCSFVYAQNYYEVPYAGKRSKLTKLTEAETAQFIKENQIKDSYTILKSGWHPYGGFFYDEENDQYSGPSEIPAEVMACYREDIPDENGNTKLSVYRVMYDFKETTKLNLKKNDRTERKCCGEAVYVPVNGRLSLYEKLIYYGTEQFRGYSNTIGVAAENIQFRICGENIFAFRTKLWLMDSFYGDDVSGRNDTSCQSENVIYRTKLNNIMDKTAVCDVEIDFPLIDSTNPFKYSAQNAYDGDPATSYVEDSENDLFEIRFNFNPYRSLYSEKKVSGLNLINGYSSSEILYKTNNRIKKIEYGSINTPMTSTCSDNYLKNQSIIFDHSIFRLTLRIINVYPGEKYSDTCLAEINLDFEDKSSLF